MNKASEHNIDSVKTNIKILNPLHRARKADPRYDGTNNPNIPGQNNELNAWMDVTLNGEEIDDELRLDAAYAKRNFDNSRFHDIDDIPMCGPPKRYTDKDITVEHATATANMLMNDSNLRTCRKTGMKIPKGYSRPATSTVSRPPLQRSALDRRHGDRRHKYEQGHWNDRYDLGGTGWDTDVEIQSNDDDGIDHHNRDIGFTNQNVSDNITHRADDNEYSRDHQRGGRHQDYRETNWQMDSRQYQEPPTAQRAPNPKFNNHSRGKHTAEYSDSSSEDERNVRYGISACPNSRVREQLTYPHFSLEQISGFIGQNITFHQLSYDQFMAGELSTMISAQSLDEKLGRMELLQRISLWRLRSNVTWTQVRNTYAHIMRRIENRETSWGVDWDQSERHIYDKVGGASPMNKTDKVKKTQSDFVFFCKLFQKIEGCTKESPHNTKVGNSFRQVHHICAICWRRDRQRKEHSESSPECPYKEA